MVGIYLSLSMASQVAQWKRVHLPSRYRFNPWIGKEMATHSSTLTWEIPWTEEPGKLQSMVSQRVGPNLVTTTTTMMYSSSLVYFPVAFIVLCSFLFLFPSSLVIWMMIFSSDMLLLICFCVWCIYFRFFNLGYHGFHIHWPIIISTRFKLSHLSKTF